MLCSVFVKAQRRQGHENEKSSVGASEERHISQPKELRGDSIIGRGRG